VLNQKFKEAEEGVSEYITELVTMSDIVIPEGNISIIDIDPDDNLILETAVIGNAAIIITGDSHLLSLRSYDGVGIMRAKELLDIYQDDSRNLRVISTWHSSRKG
jgi:predicted nucleic acid-binding protein